MPDAVLVIDLMSELDTGNLHTTCDEIVACMVEAGYTGVPESLTNFDELPIDSTTLGTLIVRRRRSLESAVAISTPVDETPSSTSTDISSDEDDDESGEELGNDLELNPGEDVQNDDPGSEEPEASDDDLEDATSNEDPSEGDSSTAEIPLAPPSSDTLTEPVNDSLVAPTDTRASNKQRKTPSKSPTDVAELIAAQKKIDQYEGIVIPDGWKPNSGTVHHFFRGSEPYTSYLFEGMTCNMPRTAFNRARLGLEPFAPPVMGMPEKRELAEKLATLTFIEPNCILCGDPVEDYDEELKMINDVIYQKRRVFAHYDGEPADNRGKPLTTWRRRDFECSFIDHKIEELLDTMAGLPDDQMKEKLPQEFNSIIDASVAAGARKSGRIVIDRRRVADKMRKIYTRNYRAA